MKLIKHLCMRHIALALLLLFVSSCKQSVKEEAISELNKVALQKVEKLFKDASDSIESNPKAALLLVNKSILLIRQRNLKQSETEALYLKGRCNRFLEKKPEAYAAITSSLKMSIEYHDNYYRVLNLIELAEIWFNQLKYKEADSLLNQADSLAQEFKFRNCLSAIYNNKAKIADNMGDKTKAFQQYLLAAELFKIEKQNKALATVYNNMGILSLDISNNKEALRYIKLSIEINKRNNYTAKLAENYNNLGVAYCATDSIDKGYEAYSISQFLYKKVGRFADLAKSYLNVANLMAKRKEFDKAEKYYDSSLVICLQYDIQYGIILNKINYGNLFAAKGFHQKAIEYFNTSLDKLKNFTLPYIEEQVEYEIGQSYKAIGNSQSALLHIENHYRLKDSINGLEVSKHINELQEKYNKASQEKEIAQLNETVNLEKAKKRKLIIIGLTFSIVILILSFVFVLRQRKTYYKNKLAKKEHEKVRLKLELKNKELVTNALHLANRSELINDIIGKLQIIHDEGETETQKSITELIKQISFELPQEVWKEFETRFEGIHEAFLESLFSEYPELSPAEIKICSFLRLNMTSKDISRLTHRSLRTIENQRNSIRKKMNLSAESSLENHLMKIN